LRPIPERIPSTAVGAALRQALPRTRGSVRVGIIQSIGNRKGAPAVEALGKRITDSDEAAPQAAAWALGRKAPGRTL